MIEEESKILLDPPGPYRLVNVQWAAPMTYVKDGTEIVRFRLEALDPQSINPANPYAHMSVTVQFRALIAFGDDPTTNHDLRLLLGRIRNVVNQFGSAFQV
ncbi:MAG: hypothetical protein ACRDJM_04305 [Actinomycetota bacterium]